MQLLTIFTPTFNREHLLPKLYNSLKNQTDLNFIWLVVDDGSTDQTTKLFQEWKNEGIINIEYHKTPNRGKPSAINFSIDKCRTELWVCVDSDDYIDCDAVRCILRDYQNLKKNPDCCGLIANMHDFEGKIFGGKQLPTALDYIRDCDIRYRYHIDSDLVRIFRTSFLKNIRYPIIENEKFIGESYLYERLNGLYYICRECLYFAKYREDGLTANYLMLHIKNPKGYKLLKQSVMTQPKPLWYQFRGAIMYVAACFLCDDRSIIFSSPRPILTFFAYPFGCLAYYSKYHKLRKSNK